jgi:hypothetical protein
LSVERDLAAALYPFDPSHTHTHTTSYNQKKEKKKGNISGCVRQKSGGGGGDCGPVISFSPGSFVVGFDYTTPFPLSLSLLREWGCLLNKIASPHHHHYIQSIDLVNEHLLKQDRWDFFFPYLTRGHRAQRFRLV